jgi:quercetin dioxygenase-like cupin family protein
MEIIRASDRVIGVGPAEWFTGCVRIERYAQVEEPARAGCTNVVFSAGARTAWHTHPLGQLLIITDGLGWVQRDGGPVEAVAAGDVVVFQAGERHWHGARADSPMTHIAIQEAVNGVAATWLEHVTDAEYLGAVS